MENILSVLFGMSALLNIILICICTGTATDFLMATKERYLNQKHCPICDRDMHSE